MNIIKIKRKRYKIKLFFIFFIFSSVSLLFAETHTSSSHPSLAPLAPLASSAQETKQLHFPLSAAHPKAKTLPKGVFRATLPAAITFGHEGFDSSGNRTDSGFSYERFATGLVFEYGVTSKISIGFGIPYMAIQNLTLNSNKFEKSKIFNDNYNAQVRLVAQELMNDGQICSSIASCEAIIKPSSLYHGGIALPTNTTIVLPTGEKVVVLSNQSFNDAIRYGVITAASPASGATGLGDLQVGFLWNLIDEASEINQSFFVPFLFAWGTSLRMPTGEFDVVSGYGSTTLPTGRLATGGDGTLIAGGGTYDAILRGNLDLKLYKGVYLGWQHQIEKSLNTTNVHRASYIHPGSFNQADPCVYVTEANQSGDCKPNTQTFSRRGFRNVGFVEVQWGLGETLPQLKILGLYSQYKYNIAAANYLNNVALTAGRERFDSVVSGFILSGLPYGIPLELGTEYETPLRGANRAVSPANLQFNVRVFGKF
ncbi:MAG: hypothetical protein K2X39_06580 [Silvanigrellaceae bacterium]|nr:hypothetical protein [Silvanigrellaceae bacterium]